MNDVLKAIAQRNSCRNFSPNPISKTQVDALVNAALAAPNAMNLQPWHIIVVTNKKLLEEMDSHAMETLKDQNPDAYKRMSDRGGTIFYNAPCVIFIAKNDSHFATLDCGIVSQNITLAAHSMGLGSVICAMANIPLTGTQGEQFKAQIKMPEGYSFGMAVCVGTPITGKEPHELDHSKVTYIGE